jgi:hypothetical protein
VFASRERYTTKIGFLTFEPDLFESLLSIADETRIDEDQLRQIMLAVTRYSNELLEVPSDSEKFEINVITYEEFATLYNSIHEEFPVEKIPVFSVAGALNLKDPDVPGYVAFSLPRQFVKNQYTFKEFLVNSAHERFQRFLARETIIAQVYEKAREDYHEKYTLSKEKNVSAFILYTLNKDLIPLEETITNAGAHLVEEFIDKNYDFASVLHLPLIDWEFSIEEQKLTSKYKKLQLKRAYYKKAGAEIARKRLSAGLNILRFVTQKFPAVCTDFLKLYPKIKAKSETSNYDLTSGITTTIQLVLQKHGLTDLMALFDQEITKL